MCYSFDVLKKMAFEKEIEHIKNNGWAFSDEKEKYILIDYMKTRIMEIEFKYGDDPTRG